MLKKERVPGEPGYLHFLVLADYIRSAVASSEVTWKQLNLKGEGDLCRLELECLAYALKHHKKEAVSFQEWVKPALEAKLKKAQGKTLSVVESDNIVELFPAEAA